MKNLYLLSVVLLLSGCVAVEQTTTSATPQPKTVKSHAVTKIDYVYTGMTRDEVKGVLGDELTIGYIRSQQNDGSLKEITLDSPYKKDSFEGKTGTYDVFYYYTHVKNADSIIAEDEMTPLVFEGNQLIGKGWDFLFRLKDNQ